MSRFDDVNYGGRATQSDIATVFRQGELTRRQQRMQVIENHLALRNERLTPQEREIDKKAKKQLQAARMELERSISVGYWRRLWLALLNK